MTPTRSARRRDPPRGGRRTWVWAFVLVAAAAGAAFWWLGPGPVAPPMDDHGEASRERLDALLREGERGGTPPR